MRRAPYINKRGVLENERVLMIDLVAFNVTFILLNLNSDDDYDSEPKK